MTLEHAIYGSATGLGDYRILAASPRFQERHRSTVIYYANVEGSARSVPFPPIFSFYALGEGAWAFTRTVYLGPTPRGNDYLVHAIALDAAAFARIDYKPFVLADAGLFVTRKPVEGSALHPLTFENVVVARSAFHIFGAPVASCLRAMSRGPLRLRIGDERAVEVCREIHESVPPSDRMLTTFCTRFSYGRNLDFRLAAFSAADESCVRDVGSDAALTAYPPPNASSPDLFDRWVAEIRGHADFDLFGLSILREPRKAIALVAGVRKLRLWTAHGTSDFAGLEEPSTLVLRPENRWREGVESVLPGALAVDLCNRVRAGQTFDECARLCDEIEPLVRRDTVQWIRALKTTATEAWMAEMLLLLADAPLEAVTEGLQRTDGRHVVLSMLFQQNANTYRALLATILGRMRDRFGAEGGSAAASVTPLLRSERDALLNFVRVMEETASRDSNRERQAAWLFAVVRNVFRDGGIAAAIPARIILSNSLLGLLTETELETFVPEFFVMEEKLADTLAATPASEHPTLYRLLTAITHARLRGAWKPRTPAAVAVVRHILLGVSELEMQQDTVAHLTAVTFLAAMTFPSPVRSELHALFATVIGRIAHRAVTPVQASLLMKALQKLERMNNLGVHRTAIFVVRDAARARPPQTLWNRLSWYLRIRRLSEVAL